MACSNLFISEAVYGLEVVVGVAVVVLLQLYPPVGSGGIASLNMIMSHLSGCSRNPEKVLLLSDKADIPLVVSSFTCNQTRSPLARWTTSW